MCYVRIFILCYLRIFRLCYVRFLCLCYVRIFGLCYVPFLGAGSPLRGSPLASLAWLASRAKLAPLASLGNGGLHYPVNSIVSILLGHVVICSVGSNRMCFCLLAVSHGS